MRKTKAGAPFPLGATYDSRGWWNFAVYCPHRVTHIVLGDYDTHAATDVISLEPTTNCTGTIWHIAVESREERLLWGWTVDRREAVQQTRLSPIVVDPYAKLLKTGNQWGGNRWSTVTHDNGFLIGVATRSLDFPWKESFHSPLRPNPLIIYEAHARGMTQHPSSPTAFPGTYLGMIDALPHLQSLGITAIELLPVAEFDECEWNRTNPVTGKRLYNYWGYAPLNFFAPMARYGTTDDPIQTSCEVKRFVEACHDCGIAVILDVVYNHTGEGNEDGPAYSYKILDESAYYIIENEGIYANYSGCGNALNANHPIVIDLVVNSLRHWALEYRVDGFRFDLASALTRDQMGVPMGEPAVIEAIARDPVIGQCLLIAEPWDAAGLYQTGRFFSLNQQHSSRFMEWNDRFRDDVRRFLNGADGMSGAFARRFCGSDDLYHHGGAPCNSINFVTSHDGFSLCDLVSYDKKHNVENGEHNCDGMNENYSWNCGIEGPTDHQRILRLRLRQIKNFLVALFLSQGVPMMVMGDECAKTNHGNNNAWCHDSALTWLHWDDVKTYVDVRLLISVLSDIRRSLPCFRDARFLTDNDIQWHGTQLFSPSWVRSNHLVACTLLDDAGNASLFVAFHAAAHEVTVDLPPLPNEMWHQVVNTSKSFPHDVFPLHAGPRVQTHSLILAPYSSLVLHAVGSSNG
jgi:glycogen debranching enzyme GlgX